MKLANWAENNNTYDTLWSLNTRSEAVFNLKFCN
jgi:hypothetical protein